MPMTAIELRRAIKRLGFVELESAANATGASAAAEFIGVSREQMARYLRESSPVPEAAAKLLRLMIQYRIKPADLNWKRPLVD